MPNADYVPTPNLGRDNGRTPDRGQPSGHTPPDAHHARAHPDDRVREPAGEKNHAPVEKARPRDTGRGGA